MSEPSAILVFLATLVLFASTPLFLALLSAAVTVLPKWDIQMAAMTSITPDVSGDTASDGSDKKNFNYELSTEDNWAFVRESEETPPLVGKYVRERETVDYTYHKHYTPERQLLQDKLMDLFHDTIVYDTDHNLTCDRPLNNWLVFTAGPMGAGKGRTMHWLAQQGLFPLSGFVKVDPDSLRELLPETCEYMARDPASAGQMTQKEVGYVAEILSMEALNEGKNVLVDGTLRNAAWYSEYMKTLHEQFPNLKFAIIHVTAAEETVLQRAAKRAERTGRLVPKDVIMETMEQIPNSLCVLAPHVHFMATFDNEGEEPVLMWSSSKVPVDEWESSSHSCKEGNLIIDGHKRRYSVGSSAEIASDPDKKRTPGNLPWDGEDGDASADKEGWREKFREIWKMECAVPKKR